MLSKLNKYHIILASKSPRRQELLRGMGVNFEILTKETPENYPSDLPLDEVPKYLSLQKSLAFKDDELPAEYLLITSDTVVICQGEILGKPKDREDASRMGRRFQNVATAFGQDAPCGDGRYGALCGKNGVVCGALQCDFCPTR